MAAVVIAASNLLTPLRDQLPEERDVATFTDTEPIQALQTILDTRPGLIVLERLFAATPRGAALINRIRTDPQLSGCEVRVMSHTGDYMRQVARPAAPAVISGVVVETQPASASAAQITSAPVATDPVPRPLDWHGTRRAPRHRVQGGTEIQLDGNPVLVVDVSAIGAQVLSSTILRPNQKVRIGIPLGDAFMRCRGAVAWAKFELPKPSASPVYRAGVEFLDADAESIEHFARRNKSDG